MTVHSQITPLSHLNVKWALHESSLAQIQSCLNSFLTWNIHGSLLALLKRVVEVSSGLSNWQKCLLIGGVAIALFDMLRHLYRKAKHRKAVCLYVLFVFWHHYITKYRKVCSKVVNDGRRHRGKILIDKHIPECMPKYTTWQVHVLFVMEYLNQKHDFCEDFRDCISEEPNTLATRFHFGLFFSYSICWLMAPSYVVMCLANSKGIP